MGKYNELILYIYNFTTKFIRLVAQFQKAEIWILEIEVF